MSRASALLVALALAIATLTAGTVTVAPPAQATVAAAVPAATSACSSCGHTTGGSTKDEGQAPSRQTTGPSYTATTETAPPRESDIFKATSISEVNACAGCWDTASDSGTWWRSGGGREPSANTVGQQLIYTTFCNGTVNNGPGANTQWAGMFWWWRDSYRHWNTTEYRDETITEEGPDGKMGTPDDIQRIVHTPYEVPHSEYKGTSRGYSCIAPPRFNLVTYQCPYDVTWRVKGPMENPRTDIQPWDADATTQETVSIGGTQQVVADSGTTLTKWGKSVNAGVSIDPNGRHVTGGIAGNLSDCVNGGWDIPAHRDEWGRYRITSAASLQTCVVRIYEDVDPKTGVYPPSELMNGRCTPTGAVAGTTDNWQQTCRGDFDDFDDPNRDRGFAFTTQDCPTTLMWCPIATNPTLTTADGRESARLNDFEVYADGRKNTLTWDVLRTEGKIRNFRDGRTKFVLDDESQPWRGRGPTDTSGGVPVDDPTQYFLTDPMVNKWVNAPNGSANVDPDLGVQIWRATFENPDTGELMPWTAYPWWRWTADVQTGKNTAGITGNAFNGDTSFTYDNAWVPQTAECLGNDANLYALRSRIVVNSGS